MFSQYCVIPTLTVPTRKLKQFAKSGGKRFVLSQLAVLAKMVAMGKMFARMVKFVKTFPDI